MTRLIPFNMKKFVEQVGQNNATRLMETLTLESVTVDMETLWEIEVFIPKGVLPIEVRSALIQPLRDSAVGLIGAEHPAHWFQYSSKAWDAMTRSMFSDGAMTGEDVSLVMPLGALSQVSHCLEQLMNIKRDALMARLLSHEHATIEDLMSYNAYQRIFATLSSLYAEALHSASLQAEESQQVEASEQ